MISFDGANIIFGDDFYCSSDELSRMNGVVTMASFEI
jgi:hypothetical protein